MVIIDATLCELQRRLLQASMEGKHTDISPHMHAIADVIPSKMCSLWKVDNHNSCLSVYAREKYTPSSSLDQEFVHPIGGSLIEATVKDWNQERRPFFEIRNVSKEPWIKLHRNPSRVATLGLKRFISIPIPTLEPRTDQETLDAVFDIYPNEDVIFDERYARTIADHLSLALSRSRYMRREEVAREIITIYKKRGERTLAEVLYPVLKEILPKYCRFEGASVFIWDRLQNRFLLEQTTGIIGFTEKDSIYYYRGEGLTGYAAKRKESILVSDISQMPARYAKVHIGKFVEETIHPGRSILCVPIRSPSRPNEVVGVIRLVNKLNRLANVVDSFSYEDLDLIEHACDLVALYMEYEQSENARNAFAAQMAHEMNAPAFSIAQTAWFIRQRLGSPDFPNTQVYSLLADIEDQADLLAALTRSVHYISERESGKARSETYEVESVNLRRHILDPARRLIIPVAKRDGVKFDNIRISGIGPSLFVDKTAFEQVFFNLLSNAIKYRRYDDIASFRVLISISGPGNIDLPRASKGVARKAHGWNVTIEDWGMGIEKGEQEKIFLMGYRKPNVEEYSVRGSGIGLAVVSQVLLDFGCEIWVSSFKTPTRFEIFLPTQLADDEYLKQADWGSN